MYMYFVRVLAADDSGCRRRGDVAVVGGVEFIDVPLVFRENHRFAVGARSWLACDHSKEKREAIQSKIFAKIVTCSIGVADFEETRDETPV